MVNRKEFISRIFSRETVSGAVKSFRAAESVRVTEDKSRFACKKVHIPELSGDMVYFEAMKLGIDPSNYTVEELKEKVIDELSGLS